MSFFLWSCRASAITRDCASFSKRLISVFSIEMTLIPSFERGAKINSPILRLSLSLSPPLSTASVVMSSILSTVLLPLYFFYPFYFHHPSVPPCSFPLALRQFSTLFFRAQFSQQQPSGVLGRSWSIRKKTLSLQGRNCLIVFSWVRQKRRIHLPKTRMRRKRIR